tara:strand:+ start:3077 stop:3409 length:333 start_codon:yes stop_codon:yes gene_type:complete
MKVETTTRRPDGKQHHGGCFMVYITFSKEEKADYIRPYFEGAAACSIDETPDGLLRYGCLVVPNPATKGIVETLKVLAECPKDKQHNWTGSTDAGTYIAKLIESLDPLWD